MRQPAGASQAGSLPTCTSTAMFWRCGGAVRQGRGGKEGECSQRPGGRRAAAAPAALPPRADRAGAAKLHLLRRACLETSPGGFGTPPLPSQTKTGTGDGASAKVVKQCSATFAPWEDAMGCSLKGRNLRRANKLYFVLRGERLGSAGRGLWHGSACGRHFGSKRWWAARNVCRRAVGRHAAALLAQQWVGRSCATWWRSPLRGPRLAGSSHQVCTLRLPRHVRALLQCARSWRQSRGGRLGRGTCCSCGSWRSGCARSRAWSRRRWMSSCWRPTPPAQVGSGEPVARASRLECCATASTAAAVAAAVLKAAREPRAELERQPCRPACGHQVQRRCRR